MAESRNLKFNLCGGISVNVFFQRIALACGDSLSDFELFIQTSTESWIEHSTIHSAAIFILSSVNVIFGNKIYDVENRF